jgi:hypothetical protein
MHIYYSPQLDLIGLETRQGLVQFCEEENQFLVLTVAWECIGTLSDLLSGSKCKFLINKKEVLFTKNLRYNKDFRK